MTNQPRKRITIEAPDGPTILAARHLDATEGPVQVGRTVDTATRSAITTVLRYIATAHNSPTVPTSGPDEAAPAHVPGPVNADDCPGCVADTLARAERAEGRLQHLQASSEAAGVLLTRTTDERDQLRDAVDRVRQLHQPTGVVAAAEAGVEPDCAVCGPNRWPCPTYNAVTELGSKEQPDA